MKKPDTATRRSRRPAEARRALGAFRLLYPPAGLALAAAAAAGAGRPAAGPSQLFLGLTYRCNRACAHCRYARADWRRAGGEMPRRLAVSALAQGRALGIPRAVFFGGEPLLYKGLDALVSKAAALGYFTELDTNGALLTPGRVEALKRAGLASVMISLHGAAPGEHDRVSGPGAFARALTAVRRCSAAGLLTYVSTCVFDGRRQAGMLRRLFAVAAGHGAHGARLLPFAGREGGADPRSNRAILAAARGPRASGFARTCLVSPASCEASRGRIVYVSPSGEVTRCPYSALPAGNLRERGLGAILAGNRGKRTGIFC